MYVELINEPENNDELKRLLLDEQIELPEYRTAVIALFMDSNDNILLQRRGPKSRDEVGKLEDIGGAVEERDFSFRDALHREIIEEVGEGIGYSIDKYVGACLVYKYDSRTDRNVNWLFLLYKCTYVDGELKINEPGKCLGYEFYKMDELPIDEVAKTTLDFWRYYYEKEKVL